MTVRKTITRLGVARLGLALAASLGLAGAAQAYEAAATTDLNMRSGPGTHYQVVDTIPGRRDRLGRQLLRLLVPGQLRRARRLGLGSTILRDASYRAPRRARRAPVYREPVIVERPIIVERPVIVREPRVLRRDYYDPYYYAPRHHRYRDYDRYNRGTGSVSFGVTFGNR